MTLTRSPDGRRASTIGLDSSTRRLTVETMRSMVCISWSWEAKRRGNCSTRPPRSTKIGSGPLTMISVMDASSSSGSRMPRPRASSTTRRISCERSTVDRTGPSRLMMWPEHPLQPGPALGRGQRAHLREVDLLQQLGPVGGDQVAVLASAALAGPLGRGDTCPSGSSRRPPIAAGAAPPVPPAPPLRFCRFRRLRRLRRPRRLLRRRAMVALSGAAEVEPWDEEGISTVAVARASPPPRRRC